MRQFLHLTRGTLLGLFFRHAVVVASFRGYLGQVGNGYDLSFGLSHFLHDVGHFLGYLAADAGVYLVEDDGGQLHGTTNHGLQRQHDAGYLTTRSYLRYGLEWGRRVGREQEGYCVLSVLAQLAFLDVHLEAHIGHTQWHQSLAELLFYGFAGLLAQFGQGVGLLLAFGFQLLAFGFQFCQSLVAILNVAQLLPQLVALTNQLLNRFGVVFLFQFVDAVQTGIDLLQFRGVEVGIFQHRAHLVGNVLQFYPAAL